MGIFRIIIFGLLFYLVYKIVKSLFQLIMKPKKGEEEPRVQSGSKASSKINSKDIIDVEFEDIKPSESSESKEKQA